jgi:hypothetical protein
MRQVTIIDTADYTVTSYGNGVAYEFINKRAKRSVFVQGDDAEQLRADLDSEWRTHTDVWCDYDSVSLPIR